MWRIPVAVGVALLIDWVIYYSRTSPANQPKTYHPNLRIWGLGLIAGIGSVVIPFFTQTLQAQAPNTGQPTATWVSYAPLLFTTAVVGFIIWAIVSLCKSE